MRKSYNPALTTSKDIGRQLGAQLPNVRQFGKTNPLMRKPTTDKSRAKVRPQTIQTTEEHISLLNFYQFAGSRSKFKVLEPTTEYMQLRANRGQEKADPLLIIPW